jgi:hypothetical protein
MHHLLIGEDRKHDEACNQGLKLEAAKATAGSPMGLVEVKAASPIGTQLPTVTHHRTG